MKTLFPRSVFAWCALICGVVGGLYPQEIQAQPPEPTVIDPSAIGHMPAHHQSQSGLQGQVVIGQDSSGQGNLSAPEIPDTTGILREVWQGISGNDLEDLYSSPVYLNEPVVRDVLPTLEAPHDWSSYYGAVLSGWVIAPETGYYTFILAGDDESELLLSPDAHPENATRIAHVPDHTAYREWDKYDEQSSAPVHLEAGEAYYIRAVMKEHGGYDNLSVAWVRPGTSDIVIIDGAHLRPALEAPAYTTDGEMQVSAGDDFDIFLPRTLVRLTGQAADLRDNSGGADLEWTQVSGPPGLVFDDPTEEDTTITFSETGTYILRLTMSDDGQSVSDDVQMVVHPALDPLAGSALREIWFDVDGTRVSDLRAAVRYPHHPSAIDRVTDLSIPRYFHYKYGERLRGYLLPPVTGDYVFWLAADETACFFLSTTESPQNLALLIKTTSPTYYENWFQRPEQKSVAVRLEAGQRYYFEVLHKELWSDDHLGVAWSLVEDDLPIIVQGEFLAPPADGAGAPLMNPEQLFFVDAGPNHESWMPDVEVDLEGDVFWVEGEDDGSFTTQWSQVSGPGGVTFGNADALETTATFPGAGVYTIRLTGQMGDFTHHRDITVEIGAALDPRAGSVLRETWLEVWGDRVAHLLTHDEYPDYPTIIDRLYSLEGPEHWHYRYGTRVRGYLHPPVSGLYRFEVRGDDETEFLLQPAPGGQAERIAHVPGSTGTWEWDKYLSQKSTLVPLQAGQRYYFEVRHKEYYGGDHWAVAWTPPGAKQRKIVPGWAISPVEDLPEDVYDSDPDRPIIVNAGKDLVMYQPRTTIGLEGEFYEVADGSDNEPTFQWTLVDGPGPVAFSSPTSLETLITLNAPGLYTLRLTGDLDGNVHSDDVVIDVKPALDVATGSILRQVWLNVYGWTVEHLTEEGPIDEPPDFEERLAVLDAPKDWGNYYGQRLVGWLHPPETGQYTFWIASNHDSHLLLSSDDTPANAQVIAHTSENATGEYRWDRYSSQRSQPVTLQAGQKYYIEILHKEHTGGDYLMVSWSGPGVNGQELLDGSFLSPLHDDAPFADGEIEISAGQNQVLRRPRSSTQLQGYAYDIQQGPEPLTYTWSQTGGPAGVVFADDSFPQTEVTFPGPGTYSLTLQVTDDRHVASETVEIEVLPAFSPDTGFVLREVWLNDTGYYIEHLLDNPDYPDRPHWRDLADGLQTPLYWSDNYGQRLRGYLYAPVSGDYRFAISADYTGQLFLSTDDDPANAVMIAECDAWAYPDEFDRRDDQISEPITLQAGQRYYVEVLHKDNTNRDFVQVAWERPDGESGVFETITGEFTEPWIDDLPTQEGEMVINAGLDQQWVWPRGSVPLEGIVQDLRPGPYPLEVQWSKISGPGDVSFVNPNAAVTEATFSAQGTYVLELFATDGVHERSDQVQISFTPAIATGTGGLLREVWNDIAGGGVYYLVNDSDYPDNPDSRELVNMAEVPPLDDDEDNYGQRLRGYLHVPQTGAYTFYLAGDNECALYLSVDEDPAGKKEIARMSGWTYFREFDKYPSTQESFPLYLEAGQKYYIEVLHKEATSNDHVSVGWTGPGINEIEIIQGGYLSPWTLPDTIPPVITLQGPDPYVITVGDPFIEPGFTATDDTDGDLTAEVRIDNNVDTDVAGNYRVHYDVTDTAGNAAQRVTRSVEVTLAAPVVASYPPDTSNPSAPPAWDAGAPITEQDAARFLSQATFGPTMAEVANVQSLGYEGWIDQQLGLDPSLHLPLLKQMEPYLRDSRNRPDLDPDQRKFIWWTHAVTAPDQLRQRVAFALSEILVISDYDPGLEDRTHGVTNYYDILVRNAFGNYREIMEEVTLSPMMGLYLTMLRSPKDSPDENYARELLQLFTIGLNHINLDGSLKLDGGGLPLQTYDNDIIVDLSKTFTGWTFNGSSDFWYVHDDERNDLAPMMAFEEFHHKGAKTIVGGAVIPAGQSAYQDVTLALDVIFEHPNVAPFISRQLIQRLVTSNPSSGYIHRVAQVFENNGQGERGDLGAVIKAILLDPEARSPEMLDSDTFGKVREPLLRLTHLLRAFEHVPSGDTPTLGRVMIDDVDYILGQEPLYSPSVFNFFYPDYQQPGPLQQAGLFTPEFQIITEPKTIDTANFLHEGIQYGFDPPSTHPDDIELRIEPLAALAGQSYEALLDQLDILVTHGQMSAETRTVLLTMLNDLATDHEDAAISALQLLSTAPEFAVQR